MTRRAYLDRSPGELRGVITLDGLPERLFIERLGDAPRAELAARHVARIARLEADRGAAFLDLGAEGEARLSLGAAAKGLAEGAWIEVEITAEARRGKLAQARWIGPADGPARRSGAPPALVERLTALSGGAPVLDGPKARHAADLAEEAVLAVEHVLPGGGSIAIEPTRALIAIDVDVGERRGGRAQAATGANLAAIAAAARLLRLKALGGLVVLDLVGEGGDGRRYAEAAQAAFAADGPGVVIGPLSRLGLLQLAAPHHRRPLAESLCDAAGAIRVETWAQRLLRALEREAEADRGAPWAGLCAPAVAEAAAPGLAALAARAGPRVSLRADPARAPHDFEVIRP